MINSISKGKIYLFGNGKRGRFTGNIKEWKGTTAILILEDLKDESIKYYVPDYLIIKEIENRIERFI